MIQSNLIKKQHLNPCNLKKLHMMKPKILILALFLAGFYSTDLFGQKAVSALAGELFIYIDEEIDPAMDNMRGKVGALSRTGDKEAAQSRLKSEADDFYRIAKTGYKNTDRLIDHLEEGLPSVTVRSSKNYKSYKMEDLISIKRRYAVMYRSAENIARSCNRTMSSSVYYDIRDDFNDIVEERNKIKEKYGVFDDVQMNSMHGKLMDFDKIDDDPEGLECMDN